MVGFGGQRLSAKELVFRDEVQRLEESVLSSKDAVGDSESAEDSLPTRPKAGALSARFDAVQSLQQKLVGQANKAAEHASAQGEMTKATDLRSSGVGNGFRRQKLAQVMSLLERETALVEAVMERLKRLQGV